MDLIAEMTFDLAGPARKMSLRIFKPERSKEYNSWACVFEIDAPFAINQKVYGESSLQALILAIKVAASQLYGSDLYKEQKLGSSGHFGGDLSIPAPNIFLDVAPYPF